MSLFCSFQGLSSVLCCCLKRKRPQQNHCYVWRAQRFHWIMVVWWNGMQLSETSKKATIFGASPDLGGLYNSIYLYKINRKGYEMRLCNVDYHRFDPSVPVSNHFSIQIGESAWKQVDGNALYISHKCKHVMVMEWRLGSAVISSSRISFLVHLFEDVCVRVRVWIHGSSDVKWLDCVAHLFQPTALLVWNVTKSPRT